jgi:glucokinase-like ROK family protein
MSISVTADQDKVRKINKSIVLNMLRLHAPISRAEVANRSGLNRSTISNIVNSLIDDGLVWEDQLQDSKIGRPAIPLRLKREGGAVIGLELGVDFIAILLTDFIAETIWEARVPTTPYQSQAETLDTAGRLIDQALSIANAQNLKPLGMGVGLPGLVNVEQGELIVAPNLHWNNVPLRSMWSQRFNIPIYIENDANLAALGEYYFGHARGVENFIYLSSGIGLGGGIMIGGKLLRGGYGYAGEIGHIQRDQSGEPCGCGRIGCWETQVGPRAVLRRVKKELQNGMDPSRREGCQDDIDNLTFETVVMFALEGNPIYRQVMEEVAGDLGAGIADLVNIFNPELVVIGGALTLVREILQPVIERTVFSLALPPSTENLRIAFSKTGSKAPVLGAVAVVLDDILREMTIV